MGYNTTVVVLNDALHSIEDDPKFGRRLAEAVRNVGPDRQFDVAAVSQRGGIHVNAATVAETHHADESAIVAVGGNCASVLGHYAGPSHHRPEDKIEILKSLAAQMGYKLVKK